MKTYSIILPFMYNGDRFPLFKASLDSIVRLVKNKPNWEICIHETGNKQYLTNAFFADYENINFRYKFSKYDRVFHRAWNLNVAVKMLSNNDYLILGDSDLIYTDQWFEEIQKQEEPCAGWGSCHFLTKEATEKYINTKDIYPEFVKTNHPDKANDAGKITFIKKKLFFELSGVPEHFKDTYGGEDNALAAKLEAFGYKFKGIEATIFHLHHEHKTLCDEKITSQAHDMLWKWSKSKWIEENKKPWGEIFQKKMQNKKVKILWCRHDRSGIINAHLLDALQEEMSKHFDIKFISNSVPSNMTLGGYNSMVFKKRRICPKTSFEEEIRKTSYDVVIADTPSLFASEDFRNIHSLKIGLIEDLHSSLEIYQFLKEQRFNIILTRYKNAIPHTLPDLLSFTGKVQWLPHSIDTSFFKYNIVPKRYNVVLLGEIYDSIYPNRAKYLRSLRAMNYFTHFPRPRDYTKEPFPIGKDYVNVLNESKIALTCSSIYHYPIMKYMEFPACGAMLVADYFPELKDLGYVLNKNMISPVMNDLKEQMKYWLSNEKERNEIVLNGIQLINKYHSIEYRAKELCNIIHEHLEIEPKFPEVTVNNYVG